MGKSYAKAFYLLTSLFFMWGLITVLVDFLIPRLKEIFELTYTQAILVQFAFFIAYGLISIPAGNILHKIGYKKGIILGLSIMTLGCLLFISAASVRMFSVFLIGYFTLASGMTILQVAANPYITVLGDEKSASSRLNLAQAFNSLGTTIAPILGSILILSDNIKTSEEIKLLDTITREIYYTNEASAVKFPFLFLALSLGVLALIVITVKLPKLINSNTKSNYGKAIKNKKLSLGAIGIFLYVGAEVAIGSFLVNYFMDMNMADVIRENNFMNGIASLFHDDINSIDKKAVVGTFVVFYWGGAMIGRFIGAYLTRIYKPNKVLSVFAVLAILLVSLSMSTSGLVALWSVLAVGLCNSIMFPTIFSIAIEDLGDLKPQGSGVLCTAIAGGAIIPLLFGFVTDMHGFNMAFIVVLCCYAYILFYGQKSLKLNTSSLHEN
jgi:MFS transporter, FHS family, L-fucose permease